MNPKLYRARKVGIVFDEVTISALGSSWIWKFAKT